LSDREREEIARLDAENAELRAELANQWEENHFEHCGRRLHDFGEGCSWPKPSALAIRETGREMVTGRRVDPRNENAGPLQRVDPPSFLDDRRHGD
jgi:hypothetical protein